MAFIPKGEYFGSAEHSELSIAIFTEAAMVRKPKQKDEEGAGPGPQDNEHERIAVAAYYIAESRGFAPGNELGDWFQAEGLLNAGAIAKSVDPVYI